MKFIIERFRRRQLVKLILVCGICNVSTVFTRMNILILKEDSEYVIH